MPEAALYNPHGKALRDVTQGSLDYMLFSSYPAAHCERQGSIEELFWQLL